MNTIPFSNNRCRLFLAAMLCMLFGHSVGSQSGYAPVNGLKMYYKIHGEGKPLVLLQESFR